MLRPLTLLWFALLGTGCAGECVDSGYGSAVVFRAVNGQGDPQYLTQVVVTVDGGEPETGDDCEGQGCLEVFVGSEGGTYAYEATACGQTLVGEVEVRGDRCGVEAEDMEEVVLIYNLCGA